MQKSTLQSDICTFFEINTPGDIDDLFIDFINDRSSTPTPLRLINRFSDKYCSQFRVILLNYIQLTLTHRFDNTCNDPLILIKDICDVNEKNHGCLRQLGAIKDMAPIFIYLLYHLGNEVANKLITEDFFHLYDGFKFLVTLSCVKKELEKRFWWGLEKSDIRIPKSFEDKIDVRPNYAYNRLLVNRYEDDKYYEVLVGITKINVYFMPYSAYKTTSIYPCFLDGFLEPFFFNFIRITSEKPSEMDEDKMKKFVEISQASFKTISSMLHDIVFNLIRNNKNCRTNFLDYVRDTFIYNIEISKMVFKIENHISNGFAYNLCNLLDKFCDKIIIENRYESIDFLYINRIAKEVEEINENTTNIEDTVQKSELIEYHKLKDTHVFHSDFNEFTSTVFTYKILFMNLSYVIFYEKLKDFRSSYYHLRPSRRLRVRNFMVFYETIVSSDFAHEQLHFFNFMIENALRYEKIEPEEKKDSSTSQINDQDLSKLITENEIVSQDYENDIILDNTYYYPISRLMGVAFEEFGIPVPEKLYELIGVIMSTTMNIHDKKMLIIILSEHPFAIKPGLFKSICDIYIKIQKYDFYERIGFRIFLNPILSEDLNKNMAHVKKEGMKLLLCVIKDLEKCLGKGLESIASIKQISDQILNLESTHTKEELKENDEYKKLNGSLKDISNVAKNMFHALECIFKLLLYIIETNISLFFYEEIKFMLINTLNYNLRLLVGPKCNSLSVANMEKYSFKPKEILGLLCSVFAHFESDELVIATVESTNFNVNIIKRALTVAREKNIMGFYLLEKFRVFVRKTEKAHESIMLQTDTIVYPDEFLDPLTFDVMKDPVRLKTSNMVVDRSTFNLIIAGDGVDPFNREILNNDSIENESGLLAQIQEFRKKNSG